MIYILIAIILILCWFNHKQKRMIRGLKNYSGELRCRIDEITEDKEVLTFSESLLPESWRNR